MARSRTPGNRTRLGGVPRSNEGMLMAAAPIEVMVVAADPEARAGLAAQLSGEPGCVVVGAVPSVEDLGAPGGAQPDVIVWDVGDDLDTGLASLPDAEELRTPIVALVQDDRDGMRALAHGAAGVLASPAPPERIVLAARTVLGGLVALDPAVAAGSVPANDEAAGEDFRRDDQAPMDAAPVEALTRRELEVLRLMAQGLANKQIAERLAISEHTAKFHVHIILGKLTTQSRTEAVVRAARLGLIVI
jgi:two-component system, NarL family, nitrate/nitrite response regulator NarL